MFLSRPWVEHITLIRISRWKLHLCSAHAMFGSGLFVPDLPFGVSASLVATDLLGFVRDHIEDCLISGSLLDTSTKSWESIASRVEVVLNIPSNWAHPQRAFMREAVVKAGLVEGRLNGRQIDFVTNGEVMRMCSIVFFRILTAFS
jgi:hypothetical protein